MSLEAIWDLRVRDASPRSVCVCSAGAAIGSSIDSTSIISSGGGAGGGGISNNPFEIGLPGTATTDLMNSSSSSINTTTTGFTPLAQAVIFGSEQGSLHYRTYPSPTSTVGIGGGSSSGIGTTTHNNNNHLNVQPPLGVTPSGRPPANLPRPYFPVDLPRNSLPGPVVGVVAATIAGGGTSISLSQRPVFLVLVDDNRGSTSGQGSYVATLVTLQHGAFSKLTTTSTSSINALPRVSCATYHPRCGFVLCGGKRIVTIPHSQFMDEPQQPEHRMSRMSFLGGGGSSSNKQRRSGTGSRMSSSSAQYHHHQYQYYTTVMDFSGSSLPPPGARGGQDGLTITSNGHVAVVAVGNSVYAVPGVEVDPSKYHDHHHDSTGTGGGGSRKAPTTMDGIGRGGSSSTNIVAPECVKVLTFGQSSQVHPVIIVDIQDRSMDPDWSSLLLANGRECAVVDIQYDSHHNSASVASPRNGIVTVASPILSVASSWPFLTLLTSDGLVSLRSPSCLAIPLKTFEVGTQPNDFFSLRTFRSGGAVGVVDQHHAVPDGPSVGGAVGSSSIVNTITTGGSGSSGMTLPWILCMSYSGQARVLQCRADSVQDLSDRFMRLSIDAFGSNGFPRNQLAEALNATFTATSYVGPEPTPESRNLLRQYLEAILGLTDFEGGASSGWATELSKNLRGGDMNNYNNTHSLATSATFHMGNITSAFADAASSASGGGGGKNAAIHKTTGSSSSSRVLAHTDSTPVVTAASPNALLTGTALLCLVCTQLSPNPKGSLANRAAKACAAKMGVVILGPDTRHISDASIAVNEIVAERLLKEASKNMTLLHPAPPSVGGGGKRNSNYALANMHMEFVEAATWLLRSCGRHERAIDVLYERLLQHRAPQSSKQPIGFWSQIKYESYTATHLSELWSTKKEAACQLVLDSPAIIRLLENNPRLGLNVFTVNHPQNANQWKVMGDREDPLAHPKYPAQVVQLLKSINPAVPYLQDNGKDDDEEMLPMDSGRALAVTFLESAIGISTNRPTEEDEFDTLQSDVSMEERIADFHDELCYLLLEGVISERGDQDNPQADAGGQDGDTTILGKIYRQRLRRLLRWPLAKIRSERLLSSLPRAFRQEQALVLGRLGRHEEALKILYCDCNSIDLALEYCDALHARREVQKERERARLAASGMLDDRAADELDHRFEKENAYLPLVRVALESDTDKKRGTASAIKILALRRGEIDRAAALRLLPNNVPVSAVARPFLIPALVDSESQARRLKVVSSLLRARHTALKEQLTEAQLKAQSHIQVVPQLKALNLGEPLHSTKPFKARPSSSASSTFPDVVIIKHFFPRHIVIQAKVTNNSHFVDGRALGNVAFVVAESSEEAIQPTTQVPIKVLPYKATGSVWCVLVASPNRMEGTAILTCELRYTVLGVDATSGTPLSFGQGSGRTFVEELQDLEVLRSSFS